jgi:hypothetical protein
MKLSATGKISLLNNPLLGNPLVIKKVIRTWTNQSAKLSATGNPLGEPIRNPPGQTSRETEPLDKPHSENICCEAKLLAKYPQLKNLSMKIFATKQPLSETIRYWTNLSVILSDWQTSQQSSPHQDTPLNRTVYYWASYLRLTNFSAKLSATGQTS